MSMFPELHHLIAEIDESIEYSASEIEVTGVGMGVAGMHGDDDAECFKLPESQVVVMYKFNGSPRAVVVSIQQYRDAMRG